MSDTDQPPYHDALREALRPIQDAPFGHRTAKEFDAYQHRAREFALYHGKLPPLIYPALGLSGEVGEVLEKVKKIYRDGDGTITADQRLSLVKELSDVLWYLAATAGDLGFTLSDIATINLNKLTARKEAGTIHGSGDNR